MTYCVATCLDKGLVFLSDTRTNAGVDHVSTFRKMTVFENPGERVLVLMTAGNLALTQAVVQLLTRPTEPEHPTPWNAPNMFEAAHLVGKAVREVYQMHSAALHEFNIEFNCSFLLGGQIRGQGMHLFQIYAAGNFIEASTMDPYFQIGEAKYGKPILDRVLSPSMPLDEAAKCALISMDSTLRSNVSVGLPLDLLVYEKDTLRVTKFAMIDQDNEYFQMIHSSWGERLRQIFGEIPDPQWTQSSTLEADRALRHAHPPRAREYGLETDGALDFSPAQTLAQASASSPGNPSANG